MLTPEQLTEIRAHITRAHTEVGEVCRRTGASRWRMSIPANPARDSDPIISGALNYADVLLAEAQRLREELAEVKDTLDATMHNFENYVDEATAERDQARGIAAALEAKNARIAELANQLDQDAAADEQSKDDVIEELINTRGSWSSQHPEVARLGALAQVQRNIAAAIRSILDPTPEVCRCGEPGRTQDQMYQCSAADCVAHDYLATGGDLSLRGTGRHPHPDLTDLRDALADGRREAGEG